MILRQFLHTGPVRLSGMPTSTIGFETRNNTAFMIDDEDEFIRIMGADVPPPPTDAARTRAANSGRTAATSA